RRDTAMLSLAPCLTTACPRRLGLAAEATVKTLAAALKDAVPNDARSCLSRSVDTYVDVLAADAKEARSAAFSREDIRSLEAAGTYPRAEFYAQYGECFPSIQNALALRNAALAQIAASDSCRASMTCHERAGAQLASFVDNHRRTLEREILVFGSCGR